MQKLSHTDNQGKALMVDVSSKPDQQRLAIAEGFIVLGDETLELIRKNNMKKGDVISVARIAGIQAAKQASSLIPLCHPLPIHHIHIEEKMEQTGIRIRAEVKTSGKTGVEMEALTAAGISLLTIYDMCKAVDNKMVIESLRLVEKRKE